MRAIEVQRRFTEGMHRSFGRQAGLFSMFGAHVTCALHEWLQQRTHCQCDVPILPRIPAEATQALWHTGKITGWRDELYPVTHSFHAPPAALIERAAAPYFGIKARMFMHQAA